MLVSVLYEYWGMLSFMFSYTCYTTTANVTYTAGFYIDGTLVDTIGFYFDQTYVYTTMPSCFHIHAPLSVGSHSIALGIPSGISVDGNARMNMTIQEFVGLS